MSVPEPRAHTTLRTFPTSSDAEDSLAAYLATRVLRCLCGFQVEVPR
jgi:hypothetical protein